MDEDNLNQLREALAATPDNVALLCVVLRAHLARDEPLLGFALLQGRADDNLQPREQALMAQVCLAAGEPQAAVDLLMGDEPSVLIERARALARLERQTEARTCYDQAVAANATLEDAALRAEISANFPELPKDGERPRLRVIANDETMAEDLVRLVQPTQETVTFADIGGLDDVKRRIHRKIILPFSKPSLFQRFKRRVGGGILLYGPPGCGKTLMARATAGECGATFVNVSIADVLDMYIGESERRLHEVFVAAREKTPSVLFFDEVEALGGKRQYAREATASKLVSQFLAEMDGFAQDMAGVLVLAATNVPWAVDPAFRRPGRFDRVQFIPPPDKPARHDILQMLLRGRPVSDDINVGPIAEATRGYSGADLRELVETAVDFAIEVSLEHGREQPITFAHLREALDEVRPTTLEWLTSARNYARYANEAGQYDEVLEFLKQHGEQR
jgi:transitional endoplasmic reticulum ATPase